jgi:hypothetical protein
LSQQKLQGRTVEGSARQAAVVIVLRQKPPALMGLALYIGFASLSLRIE